LPWQRPLGAGYRQYLHSVGRQLLNLPFITNYLVAIGHTNPVNSKFSHKIGCHGSIPQHRQTRHDSYSPSEPTTQTASQSVQPYSLRGPQSVPILYNGTPLSPQNCPFPWGDLDPHLIHGPLGPPESTSQTASRSVQPFFQGSLV